MSNTQGLVHLYYGDGKGKTTAALGLALRCAGWGGRVILAQFLKGSLSGELRALEALPQVTLLQNMPVSKFTFQMTAAETAETAAACQSLFHRAAALAKDEQACLLILDEIIDALHGFLSIEELLAFLDTRPSNLEVVLTGHDLPPALIPYSDYITCMRKEKHPYDRGVSARKEIEF